MKSAFAVLAIGVAHQTAEAKFDACGFSTADLKLVYNGLALGVQQDSTDRTTDCYEKTSLLSDQTKQFFDSFSAWSSDDWANPLYVGAELSTASTDVFTSCQTTQLAKQFAIRMNSWSGILDLFSTVGVAFLTEYVTKPGKSNLFNSFKGIKDAEGCEDTSKALGQTLHYMFTYTAQPKDYSAALPQDLVDDVF